MTTPDSFASIAAELVATDREGAQRQVRGIAERLAQSTRYVGSPVAPFTPEEAEAATRARTALVRELLK